MEESQNALNKERKKMNELKTLKKKKQANKQKKKQNKKDKGNLQLIHHGVNTENYNQGP